MAQPGNAAPRAVASADRLPADPVRLEQLVALSADLIDRAAGRDLPARFVQGVVAFLGVPAAAIGVDQDGAYQVVASAGADRILRDHDRSRVAGSAIEPVVRDGRPAIVSDGSTKLLAVPIRHRETAGALVLVLPPEGVSDDTIALARVAAALAGLALEPRSVQRGPDATRVGRDLLAAMAHDLRAPLNGLIGYAELLGDGTFGPLSAEQREVAAILSRQARELNDLLGATLDVAGLESQRLPVRAEPFTLADTVHALRAGTFARPTHAGLVSWTVADVPPLRSDRVKVKAIVQNLVDNALKHGGGAAVEVDVCLAPDREAVRISVRDRGPGIPPSVLPHVFEPFRSGTSGGTGIGLYVVRSFAEALGGRVAVRTAVNEGTTLLVELPLAVD